MKVLENSMPDKITQEEFVERANRVHNNKYIYDKTVYVRANDKVIITCPVHGDFLQKASQHLSGRGCLMCSQLKGNQNSMDGLCDVINKKGDKKSYQLWYAMLERCKRYNAYKNVVVCEEWKTFSNFKKWHDANYIEGYALDKDLFSNGSKIYSPDTCCYLPVGLNTLLGLSKKQNNGLPLGVYKSNTKSCRYRVHLMHNRKRIHVGSFSTEEEAFAAYKSKKEDLIKQEAKILYQNGMISERVYNKLMTFEVQ